MHYEPFQLSGHAGKAWLLPVVGIAAAAASAFVYAWIDVYSPIGGYISILFVLLLAAGAVLPVALAGRVLKVRSVMQLRIAGAVSGLAALYFAWAFFAWVLLLKGGAEDAPSAWFWVQTPAAIWRFANAVAENGWYTIGHSLTPTGIVIWILWGIEAAIVVGAGIVLAPGRILGRGFCEDCEQWMADEEAVMVPADEGAPAKALRNHGLGGIQEVTAPSARAARWLRISRQRCPQCRAQAVFSAEDVKMVKTDKGVKAQATAVLPLSWQTDAEAGELARIQALLDAADAARMQAIAQKPVAEQV